MSGRDLRNRTAKRHSKSRSDRRIAALLTEHISALLPNIANAINPNGNGDDHNGNGGGKCTFKHFNSCNPSKYSGTEGASALLEWFESMENTFINSECPAELRVRHAASVLQKRALT